MSVKLGGKERVMRRLWPTSWFSWGLAAIVGANFVARLIWIGLSASTTLEGSTDQASYVALGTKIAAAKRYVGFGAPPLYPILIGVVAKAQSIMGLSNVSLRITVGLVQAVLGAGMIAATGLLTRRLVRRSAMPRSADLAGLVTAGWLGLWLNQILGTSVLLTERLATPIFVAIVVLLLWDEELSRRRLVAIGLLVPLLILTRPAYAFTVPVVFAYVLTRSSGIQRRFRDCLVVGLTAFLVLSPWWLYTWSQAGGPLVTGSTSGSFNLCLGNNDDSIGYWSDEVIESWCHMPSGGTGAAAADRRLRSAAIEWMLKNPGRQPGLVAERAEWIVYGDSDSLNWFPVWNDYQGPGSQSTLRLWCERWWSANIWLALPSIAALFFLLRRTAVWIILLGASTLIAPLTSVGDPRYHEGALVIMSIGVGSLFAVAGSMTASVRLRPSSPAEG